MFRNLLVPVDGSPFAEQALPLALGLAQRLEAKLQVALVHVPLASMYSKELPNVESTLNPGMKEHQRVYLDALVKRTRSTGFTSISAALLEGPIADALQKHAAATKADLIIMTTHGRGPLARAWLGSVADDLIRRSPVPVLLWRPQELKPESGAEPSLRHVLIPLDGSAQGEQILEPALALGGATQARFTLLRVIQPVVMGAEDPMVAATAGFNPTWFKQLQDLYEQDRAEATAYLDRVAGKLRARSLPVETKVTSHTTPALAILDEAKAGRADLIALATHGRGGFPRLFLGSVADKVVRGATGAVLVQRPSAAA